MLRFVSNFYGKVSILYTSIDVMVLYGKIKPKNPFLMNFGSKRTLLGMLVVFGSFRLDLELFGFGFVVDLGLYGN